MPFSHLHSRLLPLYTTYATVIKPLVAEIEARFEQFPTPILNEIRAYNDHVARCYVKINDTRFVEEQVNKAKSHIDRIVFDCYKYLNVALHELIVEKFAQRTKYIDIGTISNGEFNRIYKNSLQVITEIKEQAKHLEFHSDKEEIIVSYQQVHSEYRKLYRFILDNEMNIRWAVARFYKRKALNIVLWLLAAIISGIIGSMITPFPDWFRSLF
ncbi:MAG: hypothetical protein LBD21_03195 [Tannerellaceae bacterium]|jgi:hypothetical protein|nr:hypothetical protein [Tannerellaceae bacterium]